MSALDFAIRSVVSSHTLHDILRGLGKKSARLPFHLDTKHHDRIGSIEHTVQIDRVVSTPSTMEISREA